jgi:hypothetical protein
MFISISVTYEDINSERPRGYKVKRRTARVRKKRRPPMTPKEKAKREERNVRSKIKRRLDDINVRPASSKNLGKKRSELPVLKQQYDKLRRKNESMDDSGANLPSNGKIL